MAPPNPWALALGTPHGDAWLMLGQRWLMLGQRWLMLGQRWLMIRSMLVRIAFFRTLALNSTQKPHGRVCG